MSTFQKLGVVVAIPAAGVTPGTGAAVDALRVELGNVLEITGDNVGDITGTLTLLRWFPPAPVPKPQGYTSRGINALGEWRRWREDAPIVVTAGVDSFSGRYEVAHDATEYWLLLVAGGAADDVTADAMGTYYRRSF